MGLQKRGEEWEEYDHAVQWMSLTVIITLLVTIFLAVISMPLGYVIGNGISKESMDNVGKFMGMIFNDPSYLFSRYWNWMRQIGNYHGPFSFSLWLPVLPILSLPIGLIIGAVTNPYRFQSNIHGSGRIATLKDIKAMKLLDGFCMVIGKFKGYYLKLPETLSTLCCAPPGTGKTLLAKAVAGEANVPFFSLSGSEFVEMFVGVGASRVRDLFEEAKKNAPCIIFIDEIDAIGKSRDCLYGGGNDEREQTLNQLLAEMDGFDTSKGLLILAATNRPEVLDPALLRPGRFDRRVIVDRPDLKGRIEILKVHARNVHLDETVDFENIALATSGAVGSDLANMINEAAILAVKSGRSAVSQKDLLEAVEVVLVGKEKKDRILSAQERRIVSYHEVGHALVSALQKDSEPVQKITIVPRTMGALGYVMQVPEEEKYLNTQKELEAMLVGYLGGRAAEEIVFDSVTTGASNDIEQMTKLARAMITRYGMNEEFDMVAMESVSNQYLGGDSSLTCSTERRRPSGPSCAV